MFSVFLLFLSLSSSLLSSAFSCPCLSRSGEKNPFQCQRQWEMGFPSPKRRARRTKSKQDRKTAEMPQKSQSAPGKTAEAAGVGGISQNPKFDSESLLENSSSLAGGGGFGVGKGLGTLVPQGRGFGPVKRRRFLRQL